MKKMKMILAVLLVITFVCTMFSASAIVPGEDTAAYSTTGVLQYEVTDPYIQLEDPSETDGKYRINSIAVYNSTMNHFAQEFYY